MTCPGSLHKLEAQLEILFPWSLPLALVATSRLCAWQTHKPNPRPANNLLYDLREFTYPLNVNVKKCKVGWPVFTEQDQINMKLFGGT